MTEAFHDLMETFWPNRLVIQLDTCEWLMDAVNMEARRWLVEDVLLLPLHNSLRSRRKQCHVVMMSNVTLALPFLERQDHRHTSLPPLDKPSVQHYLQRIGVDDPALCHLLYEMTGGHALCVSLLCDLWHHWQEEGRQISNRETLIQFQKAFYEKVETEFIRQFVLEKFSASGSTTSRISACIR